MIKKLLKWLWKGSADEHIEQKEYESTSEMVEESGEEQKQEESDTVSDKLEENQGASSKIQESKEAVEPISFKINETETGYLSPDALQIDGASYIEGMDDYEWIFQIGKKDFEALLKLLKRTNDLSEDVPTELMNYLKENGTKVSEIRDLCKDNDIKHYFENWM
jgi:Arc/MetJ-type ribon-helix-helix transcriptional regulator